MNKTLLLSSLLLVFIAASYESEIVLEDPEINVTYENAFKITNLNYVTGQEAELVNIKMNISSEKYSYNNSVIKSIKKFSSSKTSNLTFLNNDTTIVCVTINNTICKTFFATKEIKEEINECSFSIDEKSVYNDTAEINFFTNNTNYEVEYWVENIDGLIVKEKRITTNTNKKSFTPTNSGAYIIKASINCGKHLEKIIIIHKDFSENLEVQLKNNVMKITAELNEEVIKGITLLIDSKEYLITDSKKGLQNIMIELPKFCEQKSFEIRANELTYSFSQNYDPCPKIISYEPEMIGIAGKELIYSIIFFPELTDYEAYVKGTDTIKKGRSVGLFSLDFQPKEGYNDIIIKTDKNTLTDRVEFFNPLIKEVAVQTTSSSQNSAPLITGKVTESISRNELPWILSFFLLLFFIADKFKKYKKALNHDEKQRN